MDSLSESVWCWTYAFSPRKRQFKTAHPPPKKAAFETKEIIITDINSTVSETCDTPAQLQLLFPFTSFVCLCVCTCVHWCACIGVCVHSPVLPPLVLYSLLSGQAHLEIRFKTAINIELWGVKGHRSDYRIVLLEVGPNHNWAFGGKKGK